MKQLTIGLYQVTRGANIFILETAPDELTLIDAGIPGAKNLVLSAIQQLGKSPKNLKHILITHADIDHVGSLAGIASATGATIVASSESKPYIESAKSPPHVPPPISWLGGAIQRLAQTPISVNKTIKNGELLPITVGGIEALSLPGHTPDNYGYFWRERKILFAADLFFTSNNQLSLTQPMITWSREEALRSARKALDFKPTMICVGHGDAINIAQNPRAVDLIEKALMGVAPLAAI